jgi:hypothetical protein
MKVNTIKPNGVPIFGGAYKRLQLSFLQKKANWTLFAIVEKIPQPVEVLYPD